MKTNQRLSNPYPNSDTNKRYYTYEYYMRQKYGERCVKIPLDAGFTCPNIDGKCGYGGCIYCSGRGSGDFAQSADLSISEQYRITRETLMKKWEKFKCIPYFQAHTNTYAALDDIKSKFEQALALPDAVGLNVATRADCLPEDVVDYLEDVSKRTNLTVELGLQTANDESAKLINRGHTFLDFVDGYMRLKARNIRVCIHIIFGLPNESREDMINTVMKVAALKPDEVKIHLLHVIKGTAMCRIYEEGKYTPLTREAYIRIVADALTLLPQDTVICRLTGDGMGDMLVAPEWSRRKIAVINDIDKIMYAEDMWQGKNCKA